MTAALAAPPEPPTACDDGRDHGRDPAPGSTMLAVLGRIASHAGDPYSVAITESTHTIAVTLPDPGAFAAWCGETLAAPALDQLVEGRVASSVCLHGWSLTLLLHRSAR